VEEINEETLQPLMLIIRVEVGALEDKDWFRVTIDVFRCGEIASTTEVGDAELEHVEDVAVENAPNHQIIWPLLLMAPNCEQTAVVFHGLVLNQTGVFHRDEVMGVADEHLDSLTALHQLQVLQQVIDRLARLSTLHEHAALGVLLHFGFALFENFAAFVRRRFFLGAELCSDHS